MLLDGCHSWCAVVTLEIWIVGKERSSFISRLIQSRKLRIPVPAGPGPGKIHAGASFINSSYSSRVVALVILLGHKRFEMEKRYEENITCITSA